MAMGEAKEILVQYTFDGAPQIISLNDMEGCQLPSGGTAVTQDEEEGGRILRHVVAQGLFKTEAGAAARGSNDGEEQVL
jgi:hypothetical protein